MIRQIEKLETEIDTNFNKVDVAKNIRILSLKINEIIEVINSMNVSDLQDDNDEEEVILKESEIKIKNKK